MKPYEFLPHTADTRIRATDKTLAEAFTNAAYATTDTITDHTKIKSTVKPRISSLRFFRTFSFPFRFGKFSFS